MAIPGKPTFGFRQVRFDSKNRKTGLNRASQATSGRGISKYHVKVGRSGIMWIGWQGKYAKIIRALNRTAVFNSIFIRFIKEQDNVFITPFNDSHLPEERRFFGFADDKTKDHGYQILVGSNGYVLNGQLIADPTFLAKVIMHEGLHTRYQMAHNEKKLSEYPTVYRHNLIQQKLRSMGYPYEGDHQAMAEGNVGTLVQGMMQFDKVYGLSHSKEWYIAIAWMGSLTRATTNWEAIPTHLKSKYELIQRNEFMYIDFLKARAEYIGVKSEGHRLNYEVKKSNVNWVLFKKTRTSSK